MKRIALSASALALLSGIALAAPAQAASLTAHERVCSCPQPRASACDRAQRTLRWPRRLVGEGDRSAWRRRGCRASPGACATTERPSLPYATASGGCLRAAAAAVAADFGT